jgi:hypothetical protein
MGITFIPSAAGTINQATSSLIEGIDKFINPNKDLQIAVQRSIATNPELLQHMADLEGNAPGTMQKLGLGNLANVIGAVPQSAAATAEAATRPGAAKQAVAGQTAATSTSELTTQKNALTSDIVQKAGKIMAADPSISFDAAMKTLTGETQSERTANQAKSKVIAAESEKQLDTVKRNRNLPENLADIDWTTEARDFMNGDLSGAAAAAYFGNQDTREAFTAALHNLQLQRQLDAQKAVAALRGDGSVSNFRTQKAFQEYQKSGGVGTLQDWENYLFDPKTQDRARALIAGAKPENEQDRALLGIAKVNDTQIKTDKLREVTLINDKLTTQLKRIDEADGDEVRQQHIDGLNSLLRERAALGGLNVTAEWEKRPWYQSDRLKFTDKAGKVVPVEKVNAVLSDPNATDIAGPPLSPVASEALAKIMNYKGDKMSALGALKMQDKSPDKAVSREVEQAMQAQGLIKVVGASPK